MKRVLDRDLDPDHNLENEAKVVHELSPYGLSEIKWRCYILHLVNQHQSSTLTMMARRLVKGLETKISEVELTLKCTKKPISDLDKKEAKLYLAKIREDRFKIKNLVNCFPTKRLRDKVFIIRHCSLQ